MSMPRKTPAMEHLSLRAETAILKMSVQASDYEAMAVPSGSTLKTGLAGIESCGQMARTGRAQFLALAIWVGFSQPTDIKEIKSLLMHKSIGRHSAFDAQRYLSDSAYRSIIDNLIDCAVCDHQQNKKHCATKNAKKCQISVRWYNLEYRVFYDQAQSALSIWLTQAAQAVHMNSRD